MKPVTMDLVVRIGDDEFHVGYWVFDPEIDDVNTIPQDLSAGLEEVRDRVRELIYE